MAKNIVFQEDLPEPVRREYEQRKNKKRTGTVNTEPSLGGQERTPEAKIELIASHFEHIMQILGLDLNDASLKDTPMRVAKMYVNELCATLSYQPPKFTMFPTERKNMVIVKDIQVVSICEHHWMPIIGKVHIGYIPNGQEAGLSKFNRMVAYLAAKPCMQERLTHEIGLFLKTVLTPDVMVVMKAKHHCCASRGVRDPNSDTVTSFIEGKFFQYEVRNEFLQLLAL